MNESPKGSDAINVVVNLGCIPYLGLPPLHVGGLKVGANLLQASVRTVLPWGLPMQCRHCCMDAN